MFFFLKRKKLVVDAYTCSPQAYRYFPIESANNFIPEWFKNTPKEVDERPISKNGPKVKVNNIRRCAGIIDYYSKSNFIIPLWSDMRLELSPENYKFVFADEKSTLVHHDKEMRGSLLLPDYEHFKILSPWRLQEKTGIQWHVSNPYYNNINSNIIIPPGIVNYKYQMATEINFFVKHPSNVEIIDLEAGTPLSHLVPITEKEIDLRVHLLSEAEWTHRSNWIFSFNNTYQKAKKIQQKQGSSHKCPFGFK